MREYESLHLIKGEDLNHHGTLFAARAAAWFVESAFAAAACAHGNSSDIVCRNLHNMSFCRPVRKGSVVSFKSRVVHSGKTSLMVYVKVLDAMTGEKAVDGYVTFVTVEEKSGKKLEHGIVLDEPEGSGESRERETALEIIGAGAGKREGNRYKPNKNKEELNVAAGKAVEADTMEINTDKEEILKNTGCFALDMDGTVYLGEQWIEGACEFLREIEKSGKNYVFLTNNSSKNPDAYVEKLKRMGLHVERERIVTSGQAAIYYLKKNHAGKRVFLLGNEILKAEFLEEGIVLDEDRPEVVVTAFDTSLDYAKMCRVCDFVRAGLPYIATHPDYNCPTEDGFIPDAGAIHAFIHASAGRYPDRIIGKPNGDIVDYLIARTGAEREKITVVGDRLYTDIATGRNHGLKSVLVLSGEAVLADLPVSEVKPDLIFASVKEMTAFL